jgi:uncharacterized protein
MPTYLSPGVYVEEAQAGSAPIEGAGTAVAAFVGFAQRGPANTPTLVSNWTQFTQTFGEFMEGGYLAQSVYGYFQNGGGNCYIVRVGANGASGNGHGPVMRAELPALTGSAGSPLEITAREDVVDPGSLRVEVAEPKDKEKAPDGAFRLIVRRGEEVVEEHEPLTAAKGRTNAATVVNRKSTLITITEPSSGELAVPAMGSVTLTPAPEPTPVAADIRPDTYIGDASARTGFGGLEAIDAVTMVAVPDALAALEQGMIDLEGLKAIQLGMIAHCEQMGDRVAIIDPPPSMNAQEIRDWRMNDAGYDSKYAAMYWPWIKVFDPASGENVFVPPSGHVAGVWGRNDDTRGVHKAPANEVIRGALAPELLITSKEQELLNPEGINVIRTFPGRGVRIWGARTLSSDPAWRYLNVRRLFNYIEESILNGTQWAVFEPNDHDLWAKMRRTIASFLVNEWRKGALFGLTPDQAFYVKCDDETNPAEQIDAGMVVCEIGIAPVKPAEFVVFRLSQFSGGASTVE